MSESLFQLTGEYREIYALLTEEPDSEVVQDSLESVMGAIEAKSEGYVAIINQLEMEEEACKRQIEEWTYRRKVRENAQKRLKERMVQAMEAMGKKEIKAGATTICLRNNGGQLPLRYFSKDVADIPKDKVDMQNVPKEFRRTVITETIDTDKVRKALDRGEKLNFVEYGERGKGIRFK